MFCSNLVLAALGATAVTAYTNNCKGSSYQPDLDSCRTGIATIDAGTTYSDQSQFSSGDCYIIYATNGATTQVSGQVLIDTANSILGDCDGHGSYGTNNDGCTGCHVTINYRVAQ